MVDPVHQQTARRLLLLHHVLRRNFDRISEVAERREAVAGGDLADFIDLTVGFLETHHAGEDAHIYPALRAHTAGKSSDVAFIDARQAEHREVHGAAQALSAAAATLRNGSPAGLGEVARATRALGDIVKPHLAIEEEGLAAERLAEMIPAPALAAAIAGVMEHDRRRGGASVLMLLAHSLDAAERADFFPPLPWIVARVLAPWVFERRYRRFLPFSYQREAPLP